MFRLLFVMVTTVLVGLGTGYFLWGNRAARLTESLNTLTLEMDTLRARLKAPTAPAGPDGQALASPQQQDQLRMLGESLASIREDLAEQKELIGNSRAGQPPLDPTSAAAQLRNVRQELTACIADKQDLEMRQAGRIPPPPAGYRPPPVPTAPQVPSAPVAPPVPSAPASPSNDEAAAPVDSPPADLDDPRY